MRGFRQLGWAPVTYQGGGRIDWTRTDPGAAMLIYRLLADGVVMVHVAWVLFLVLGQVAIVVGLALGKSWARNVWFRSIHLAMIGYVVLEAVLGWDCPLTVWEQRLRERAGQETYPGDFLGTWAHRLLFVDAEPWVFTLVYALFGLLVAATFVGAPPRRSPPRQPPAPETETRP